MRRSQKGLSPAPRRRESTSPAATEARPKTAGGPPPVGLPRRAAHLGLLLAPAAGTVFLSFRSGGFFAGTPGVLAVVFALLLVLYVTLAEGAFEGLGVLSVVAGASLALFAGWTLVSVTWSDAPGRALVEWERALCYVFGFLLLAALRPTSRSLPPLLRSLAAAFVLVCAIGLATRLAPDLVSVTPGSAPDRLDYPLTYWNAFGLMAALGLVLCLHLACSEREPALARVLGAAACPVVACALFFTFSRGAIAAGIAGLVAYLIVGRPRALLTGLPVVVVATGVALNAAYAADLLATREGGAAAVSQGHEVALVLGLCVSGAALVRAALLPVDRRIAAVVIPRTARLVLGGAAAFAVVGGILALTAFQPVELVERQVEAFRGSSVGDTGDARDRLDEVGNNRRLDQWVVALRAWQESPTVGSGAGTYQLLWQLGRPDDFVVYDGHSLYLEVLAELGWVGLVLLGLTLATILGGLLWRARAARRPTYAAAFAAVLAWAGHAGLDWDWEMPAVTLWVFCVGAVGLATGGDRDRRGIYPTRFARVLIGLGVLILVASPALMAYSQRSLDRSVLAFRAGNCPEAIDASLEALDAVGSRPEPFQVLAACDARLGRDDLAVRAMENAVARDPRSWEVHYELAIVRGVAGLDPRPAARAALLRNPNEALARDLLRRLRGTDRPREWERRARSARLPFG